MHRQGSLQRSRDGKAPALHLWAWGLVARGLRPHRETLRHAGRACSCTVTSCGGSEELCASCPCPPLPFGFAHSQAASDFQTLEDARALEFPFSGRVSWALASGPYVAELPGLLPSPRGVLHSGRVRMAAPPPPLTAGLHFPAARAVRDQTSQQPVLSGTTLPSSLCS